MKNKKSIWSTIILIVALVTLVLLVISVVSTIMDLANVEAAVRAEAEKQGVDEEAAIVLAIGLAQGAIIAGLVIGSIFDVLEIIGGLLFSLKGKWGMFCIVASIIALVFGFIRVITNSTNGSDGLTIALNFVDLILAILFCIASFKHRKENKELALQEQAQ